MRILLVSDIHGNAPALAAVREEFDVCLCMGDLVEYGPDPGSVIDWVRENADHCVRGNHDHGTAQDVEVLGVGGFRYLTMATRRPTVRQLSAVDRRYLADLPTTTLVTIDRLRFLLVHASPRDPMDEYVPSDPAVWANRVNGWNVDFVCVGHTHQQFTFAAGGSTIVNPGSVGLQRDGNPMVRYAVIEDGVVQLKSVPYDIEATVSAVQRSSYEEKAKKMLVDVYRSGRFVHPSGLLNGHANGAHTANGLVNPQASDKVSA